MGIFLSISATDLALQIKKDEAEAMAKIQNLALHYNVCRERMIALLKMEQSDAEDVTGVINALNLCVATMDNLKAMVLSDIAGFEDGSLLEPPAPPPPPDPPPGEE